VGVVIVKALTVRQPWAWAIFHAGKDVENRTWPTGFRGRLLIHAAKGCTKAEYADAADWIGAIMGRDVPPLAQIERGGIVGAVTVADCVSRSPSPWFVGDYGFTLTDRRPLPFVPCVGALGLWRVPADVVQALQQAIADAAS